MPADGLAEVQRWLQDAIVRPTELPRRESAETRRARDVVRGTKSLPPDARVAIYARMYGARMLEALRQDYPVLACLLGDAAFARLARQYVTRHPSRHYSLNPLGSRLPVFLESGVPVKRRALATDVARLELAMTEVFDAPEVERLDPGTIAMLPPSRWGKVRLVPIPALRVLALEHRANALVTAVRREEPWPSLRRCRTWVAVARNGDRVWRHDLDEAKHAALAALVRGKTLSQAIGAAMEVSCDPVEVLVTKVGKWFSEWAREGFFAAKGAARRP